MTDRRPYARFYYPEFIRDYPDVYADDRAFATWVRLLVLAEQMWPMPVELPRSIRPRALRTLVAADLVTITPTGYLIKGHDAERSRRRAAARKGADARWDADADANADANAYADADADADTNAMPSTSTSTSTSITPSPTAVGRRKNGTNPRATGQNARSKGTSPRQERQAQKTGPTKLAAILAEVAAREPT